MRGLQTGNGLLFLFGVLIFVSLEIILNLNKILMMMDYCKWNNDSDIVRISHDINSF